MEIPVRKTLIGCKVIDIEERQNDIIFYLQNEQGAVFAVNIEGKYSNTILVESRKVAALEGMVRAQPVNDNINKVLEVLPKGYISLDYEALKESFESEYHKFGDTPLDKFIISLIKNYGVVPHIERYEELK